MKLRGRLPTGDWSQDEITSAENYSDQVTDILQYALGEIGALEVDELSLEQRTAVETLALLDRAAKHAFDRLGIGLPELSETALAMFRQVHAHGSSADDD